MDKSEIPQERSALEILTPELCYAKNKNGKYETALSSGWNVKADALDNAWDEIKHRIEDARNAVLNGDKSPVFYYMEKNLMDVNLLASYTGFWRFAVKRHLKKKYFKKLNSKKRTIYADVFNIQPENLDRLL